ncbi:MAG: class III poly(R)-hydroxyalkanoic acid synthase subunit PhaC [Arenicella sp.]
MTKPIDSMFTPVTEMFSMATKMVQSAEALARVKVDDIDVGTSGKTKVAEIDKVTLYRYHSLDNVPAKTKPVLIVYGLIGRYTMIDLQEDRSLVKNLLSRGVDLYVVDWGYPSRADQFLNFEDYICHYLDDCVDNICETQGIDSLDLLGICEGGVFTTMYAAQFPEKVSNLIVTITPIDFQADKQDDNPSHGFINLWTRNLDDSDIENMVDAFGNLPGDMMGAVFQALTPMRSLTKYNLDFAEMAVDDEKLLNFLRMEKWLADRPNHPGAAAKQWLIELYKENRLIKGEFQLGNSVVNLKNIDMPVLNVFAEKDHIVPPPCSTALGEYVSSRDYTELPLPSGHVGIYVSSKLQDVVSNNIYNWLAQRQT